MQVSGRRRSTRHLDVLSRGGLGALDDPVIANSRSNSSRMAVSLERCVLTIISYSSVVLAGDRILSVLPVR